MPRPVSDKLTFHRASGQWRKSVGRRTYYFGPDFQAAMRQWLADKPYILAGQTPPRLDTSPSLAELANVYVADLRRQLDAGQVGQRHFANVTKSLGWLVELLGRDCRPQNLTPVEWGQVKDTLFEPRPRKPAAARGPNRRSPKSPPGRVVKRRAVETVAGDVRRIRAFLSWCSDAELVPAMRWGRMFNPATKISGPKPTRFAGFEAEQLRELVERARVRFRPILLLGLNGGLGASDIAAIQIDQLPRLTRGQGAFFDLPRRKTGTDRRVWLWPETVDAIIDYRVWRPAPLVAADAATLFLTNTGRPWVRVDARGHLDGISAAFRKLRIAEGIPEGSFYDLRRMFQTIGSESKDFQAVRFVMGHEARSRDMSDRYTLRVSDDRIKAACEHVRSWYLGNPTDG